MKRLVVISAVVLLAACGKEAPPPARIDQPVLTHVVGTPADADDVAYSGEIHARYETTLAFRVSGKVVARAVDAGALVRAGQVLARLDPADTGLQASAAESQFQLADADAKRYRELRARGFVSQAALDARETALKAAAAQAGLARNQAAYTTLRADHDGVIAATLVEAGQVVSAGQPVLRLAQSGAREVQVAIPESRLNKVKIGMPATIRVWAEESLAASYTGQLRELAAVADPMSRTYAGRVTLEGKNALPALGMSARVIFTDAAKDEAAAWQIPLSAIFQQGDQPAVWVVGGDQKVTLRPVKITAWQDDAAIVGSGLAAGERIVAAGVHKLSPGEKIRVVKDGLPR
jgi:RND family efflux transporter MFP subunit